MTEEGAIKEIIENMLCDYCIAGCDECDIESCSNKDAFSVAIKALEEVQQYRQICTVEECRAWKEKQNAKKIISFYYNNGTVNYGCPVCKQKIISKIDGKWCGGTFNEYCGRCGQKLDWSDEDGKID